MYYNEKTVLFLDGEFHKASESSTDLYGQTLHYGYGVFEGIRAYNTQNGTNIFKAKEHYDRLRKSAELMNIPFSYTTEQLTEISHELLRQNGMTDAYLRPLVFCAPNMSLYRPNSVSLMIAAWEWGAYLGEKRLHLYISSYCRPHPRSTQIAAKVCGHYVNSILATTEAKDKGYDEALLLDSDGFLAESSGSNLFFEKEGILYTPQLGNILPGITRATVIELCQKLNIPLQEGLYPPEKLLAADSAFLCGTAAEVIGLNAVNDYHFPQAWEASFGAKLQKAYKDLVLQRDLSFQV
jgi:branched-chain amino acid aminotransferase